MNIENDAIETKVEYIADLKKEVVAFANSHDGVIYLDIDDDGKIIGLKNPEADLTKAT
ncbi:MAG: ATP-binding protein, partial [Streptococcaceae bacterium]|nr:ATP-binding protein [Streptococcaceae bacterium]